VVRGESDIAFTLADTAADAATGRGAFDGPQGVEDLHTLTEKSVAGVLDGF
jgi:TRAP-type uncharacterized transport system substrate-binding protein